MQRPNNFSTESSLQLLSVDEESELKGEKCPEILASCNMLLNRVHKTQINYILPLVVYLFRSIHFFPKLGRMRRAIMYGTLCGVLYGEYF